MIFKDDCKILQFFSKYYIEPTNQSGADLREGCWGALAQGGGLKGSDTPPHLLGFKGVCTPSRIFQWGGNPTPLKQRYFANHKDIFDSKKSHFKP